MNKIVFMFSGQGSQYYQMGRQLFDQEPVFQYWLKIANKIYQDETGLSIINELYNPLHLKSDVFSNTLQTHPAIFMVGYAIAQTLLERGIEPSLVLGTSIGEIVAAVFSNVISLEQGLKIIAAHAKVFLEFNVQGGMLAIFADSKIYDDEPILNKNVQLAARNFHSHFVVSGRSEDLKEVQSFLKKKNILCQLLAVSHAFHSSEMDSAKQAFLDTIKGHVSLVNPIFPIVSPAYPGQRIVLSADYFWNVTRLPIEFQHCIMLLEAANNYHYIDVGPSGSLATFVKYNLTKNSSSKAFVAMNPYGQDIECLSRVVTDLR